MHKPMTILLADDDYADQVAFMWAAQHHDPTIDLRVVSDGDEALRYLFEMGKYSDRIAHPVPDVVVIDLNMPRVSGFAILNALRSDVTRSNIPIVVMSNSSRPSDKIQTRVLGAREYCLKPRSLEEYEQVVTMVVELGRRNRVVLDKR